MIYATPGIPRTNSAKRKPNYGYHALDHHWIIAHEPNITAQSAAATEASYVQRLQMLLSVDDIVTEVTELLDASGVRDSTYLIYCADHGNSLGLSDLTRTARKVAFRSWQVGILGSFA